MTFDPVKESSNQNSYSNRKKIILTDKQNSIEYALLDDKIVLPEDFAELNLEIESSFMEKPNINTLFFNYLKLFYSQIINSMNFATYSIKLQKLALLII